VLPFPPSLHGGHGKPDFTWILEAAANTGFLSPKAVFIDGTHIKAGANAKKQVKAVIPVASQRYAQELRRTPLATSTVSISGKDTVTLPQTSSNAMR
jgi:hypothetical protein